MNSTESLCHVVLSRYDIFQNTLPGIKPTYGRVSRYGLISYASSLDQVGAFGRSVEDCAMLLNAICGYDRFDTTSANVKKPNFLRSLKKGIKGDFDQRGNEAGCFRGVQPLYTLKGWWAGIDLTKGVGFPIYRLI